MCDFYLSFKVLCIIFFFFRQKSFTLASTRWPNESNRFTLLDYSLCFRWFFSVVLFPTWQHKNKSHNAFQLATFFVSVMLEIQSLHCVSSRSGKLSSLSGRWRWKKQQKITAAFYKCLPFELLSWHVCGSRRAEKKTANEWVGGWFHTWTSKHITLYAPPSKHSWKTSNGIRRTCQFIVHIKLNRIHFDIVIFILTNGVHSVDAIWKSLDFGFLAPLGNIIVYIYRF